MPPRLRAAGLALRALVMEGAQAAAGRANGVASSSSFSSAPLLRWHARAPGPAAGGLARRPAGASNAPRLARRPYNSYGEPPLPPDGPGQVKRKRKGGREKHTRPHAPRFRGKTEGCAFRRLCARASVCGVSIA